MILKAAVFVVKLSIEPKVDPNEFVALTLK